MNYFKMNRDKSLRLEQCRIILKRTIIYRLCKKFIQKNISGLLKVGRTVGKKLIKPIIGGAN